MNGIIPCAESGPCTCGTPFKKVPYTGPCGVCGKLDEGYTHADRLFGCCNRSLQTVKFKHFARVDREYREDLARFPGDPEAFVDGRRSLQKLIDKRKREGCEVRTVAEVGAAGDQRDRPVSAAQLAHEAYQEARNCNLDTEYPKVVQEQAEQKAVLDAYKSSKEAE